MATKSNMVFRICLPAVIYLGVGLLNSATEFISFAHDHVKTNSRFLQICLKLIVIFVITIGLNMLCIKKIRNISWIISAILSTYLLLDAFRIVYQMQPAAPYIKPPPLPTTPIFHLKTMNIVDPHEFFKSNVLSS
jgi:Ni/Fe-hydrogenase subunit HybB-like protein